MDELKCRIQSSAYMDISKARCTSCQQTKCSLKNCPITKLVPATTPQEEECKAKENLARIIRNLKAMTVEDRMGTITTLFEEESLSEPPIWYQHSMSNHGMEQSQGTERPAHICTISMTTTRKVSKAQVKKELQQFDNKEQKEIMLLAMKGMQTKPQLLGTVTKWHNNISQDPGRLHPNTLRIITQKLHTPKWQLILQKHTPTPAMMGGILILTTTPKEDQEDTSKPAQINMMSTPQPALGERQKTTVACICVMSTKNPELK